MRPTGLLASALFLFASPQLALAQPPVPDADHSLTRRLARDPVFQNAHPDLHYRALATQARGDGKAELARRHDRMAARYADKLSQAALAEMYHTGEGGERNPALAYAWMDLAAERGTPWLVALRESYWAGLDQPDRARAVAEGRTLYETFGDPAAKPRLETLMRTTRNAVTGSRLGAISNGLRIYPGDSAGNATAGRDLYPVTAEELYPDRYWVPALYWAAQDQGLEAAVDIGPP